ncbi:MAG: DUF1588 domain-containing protein [Deltaproteobacteria bacterium]|nr:DUF1588 domain-containing protein [Deltaproteobacteria bacterium]
MRRLLLLLVLAGCTGGAPASPGGEPAEELTAGYLGQRLRRLGSRELQRSIEDLTSIVVDASRVANLLVPRKYDNGDPDTWVTSDALDTVESVAWWVADEVVKTKPARVYSGCSADDACRAQLLGVVVPRIYRRPLRSAEASRYDALWREGAGAGTDDAVRLVLAAALQSPAFLYREEIGTHDRDDRVALLEPHEIGAEISYLVVGSTPDDELLAAAREGRLATRADRLAQVDRLLATPRAAEQQKHFLDLYLATSESSALGKSPSLFPGFRGRPLGVELGRMLEGVIEEGASPRALLTLPHALGPQVPASYADGAPPVRGVLMHPGFLATHASYDHSNPVARGLFVLTNLLCAAPSAPPPGIPRAPNPASQQKTTRGRFAEHSSQPMCQSCHRAIDGIGFGFEEYDAIGRFRVTENGEPVDASGLLPADGREVPYRGVRELTEMLASSQQVSDCYSRHIVRFALGAGERDSDVSVYENLSRGSTPDTTYADRIRRVVASPAFVERRLP